MATETHESDSAHKPGDLVTHDLMKTDSVREPIVKRKVGNLLFNPATASNEHYTPEPYAEAIRDVLRGVISLDPASCQEANRVVRAERYHGSGPGTGWSGYTDGLERARSIGWHGTVFLNPPGGFLPSTDDRKRGPSAVPEWWRTLVRQWEAGNVSEAIFLAFNMNVFRTAQSFGDVMPPHMFPFCVPSERICFDRLDANGKRVPGRQPPQDSAIIYLPPIGDTTSARDVRRFNRIFGRFGAVRV